MIFKASTLRKAVSRIFWGSSLCIASAGCMQQYVQPTAKQPHAIAKFRRTYLETPGTSLNEQLTVNDTWAFQNQDRADQGQVARTDAVLLHPGRPIVELLSTFSHTVSSTRMQSYICGTSTCWRRVSETRTVIDGRCEQKMALVIHAGESYLLELNYQDASNCSARCYRQERQTEASFKNVPCERFVPSAP